MDIFEQLRNAKFSKSQAEAILKILGDLESRMVTKNELKLLKADLIIHIYAAVGVGAAIMSLLLTFKP